MISLRRNRRRSIRPKKQLANSTARGGQPSATRTALSREGWLYLLIVLTLLAAAVLREINLLLVLFGMLIWPLVFSWRWVITSLRHIEVRRHVPDAIHAGELLVIGVEARSKRRRMGTWAIVVEDACRREIPPVAEPAVESRVLFPYLAAGETRRLAYQGRLMQRGRYRFGPLRITTRFPFGFVRRTVMLNDSEVLTVYPRLGRLTSAWTHRRQDALQGSQQTQRPRGLQEGDYHGLRDWRPGDSKRWIHWRTSARRGELMVRQFEQERNQDMAVLVDLWQPAKPQAAHLIAVEQALRFAATLVADRCRLGGSHLGLAISGSNFAATKGAASQALLRETMQSLAVAEACHDDGRRALVRAAGEMIRPGADVVLVSTRAVDKLEWRRIASGKEESRAPSWLDDVLCVDSGGRELAVWFDGENASG